MKPLHLRANLLIILFFSSYVCIGQGWIQLNDFPSTARDDGTSFTINSITYCGTGLDATWNATNDFYALDMTTDNWSMISGLPIDEARQYANGFASSNYGYIFGGLNTSGYLNDLWQYDPSTDSWIELSPMPSVGRSGASCFVIGDTAYILGGQTSVNPAINESWAYSISSDTWIQKNDLPASFWRASSIAFQGKGYLAFGRNNTLIYQNSFYEYDPSADSWTSLSDFPGVGRTYVGLAVLNNELVTVAGFDSIGNSYNDFWTYSLSNDSWSLNANLPSDQRRGGICFHSGTALYYTTGIDLNNVRLNETWKFDLFLDLQTLNEDEIYIYPNPVQSELKVHNSFSLGDCDYQINSVNGQLVQSGQMKTKQPINVQNLETGQYLITLKWQSRSSTKRFVIY